MIKHVQIWIVTLSLLFISLISAAQVPPVTPPGPGGPWGGGPGGGGPPITPPGPPRNRIPIDGGLSLLLAAGVAYGARKVYVYKKQEDEEV